MDLPVVVSFVILALLTTPCFHRFDRLPPFELSGSFLISLKPKCTDSSAVVFGFASKVFMMFTSLEVDWC